MKHVVQQGECLSSLAARLRMTAKELHELAENAELKKLRPNPNVLAPGDEVWLPDQKTKSVPIELEKKHRFVVKLPKLKLRVVMKNAKGEPHDGKRFRVLVGNQQLEGTTSAGVVEVDVPATARTALVQLWLTDDPDDPDPDLERELSIGCLDPIETVSGVQARLSNLGHVCPITGEVDAWTLHAAQLFRAKHGLPLVEEEEDDPPNEDDDDQEVEEETDEEAAKRIADHIDRVLDAPFRDKLREVYGG